MEFKKTMESTSDKTLGSGSTNPTIDAPLNAHLKVLREAISNKPPFCSGTLPVSKDDLILFFGKERDAKRIDLSFASEDDLKGLCAACDPATFGLGDKNVHDETYRKALKLDTSDFATNINVERSGLIKVIQEDLLEGFESTRPIRADLYKLNVYGPGSFFKKHKDSPRSELMFGSLVIIFPTVHVGGALQFSLGDKRWDVDSAKAISEHTEPCIAYAAFFSDVDHEVIPVVSGYRVTITYNLYFEEEESGPQPHRRVAKNEIDFRNAFKNVLKDQTFLPDGGYLGFGLRHQYAMKEIKELLEKLEFCTKGSDSIVHRVCRELGLETSFQVLYTDNDKKILVRNNLPEQDDLWYIGEFEFWWKAREWYDGKVVEGKPEGPWFIPERDIDFVVHWVTDVTRFTTHRMIYMAHGNKPETLFKYGDVCLIVNVKPFAQRTTQD